MRMPIARNVERLYRVNSRTTITGQYHPRFPAHVLEAWREKIVNKGNM
jgi:hypothetical protein